MAGAYQSQPRRQNENNSTSDVLFEDIILFEDGVDEPLRVFVHDEDLPSLRCLHGPNGFQVL